MPAVQYEFLIYLMSIRPQPLRDPSYECKHREKRQDRVADQLTLRTGCAWSTRQFDVDVERVPDVQRQSIDDTTARVDYARNSVVGGPQQGQSILHGPQLRLPEMLVWAGRIAKPGIVRDIHNKPG